MASAVGQHRCRVHCGKVSTTKDSTETQRSRGEATAPSASEENRE